MFKAWFKPEFYSRDEVRNTVNGGGTIAKSNTPRDDRHYLLDIPIEEPTSSELASQEFLRNWEVTSDFKILASLGQSTSCIGHECHVRVAWTWTKRPPNRCIV